MRDRPMFCSLWCLAGSLLLLGLVLFAVPVLLGYRYSDAEAREIGERAKRREETRPLFKVQTMQEACAEIGVDLSELGEMDERPAFNGVEGRWRLSAGYELIVYRHCAHGVVFIEVIPYQR